MVEAILLSLDLRASWSSSWTLSAPIQTQTLPPKSRDVGCVILGYHDIAHLLLQFLYLIYTTDKTQRQKAVRSKSMITSKVLRTEPSR